jgi:hypothetical protein
MVKMDLKIQWRHVDDRNGRMSQKLQRFLPIWKSQGKPLCLLMMKVLMIMIKDKTSWLMNGDSDARG